MDPRPTAASNDNPAADAGPPDVAILLYDADPLARSVVRHELETHERFTVVAETGDDEQLVKLCVEHEPDILVLEPPPKATTGELIRRLGEVTQPPRVVAFSLTDDDDVALAAVRAGADGYVSKGAGAGAVAAAVEAVVRGEVAISRTLTMRVIESLREAPSGGRGLRPVQSTLTDREWEVLDMMAEGCSTRTISRRLVLSEATIYSHAKSILRKLDVHSREEAVARARELREQRLPPGDEPLED